MSDASGGTAPDDIPGDAGLKPDPSDSGSAPAPTPDDGPRISDHLGVALASAATIALQVALTRIFSITLWHHFAYLVVGLAMLGFGVAGTQIALRGVSSGQSLSRLLASRSAWASVATLGALMMALLIRPNALQLFQDRSVIVALIALVVLCTVPFYCMGYVIAAALGGWAKHAGRVYAADLVGGGVGGAVTIWVLPELGALGLLGACAGVVAVAGVLFSVRQGPRLLPLACLGAVAIGSLLLGSEDSWVRPAPSKELALFYRPGQPPPLEHRRWTAHGRVDVSKPFMGPPLVAGIVGTNTGLYQVRGATQDGSAPTTMHRVRKDPVELMFLPHASTAAVWHLRGAKFGPRGSHPPDGPEVLIIGAGGGVDLMLALSHGAKSVTGVDINPAMLDLLQNKYKDFTGKIADRPEVTLVESDGRAFVRASDRKYSVIQLSGVDTFTALTSGAYSIAEAYVYTRQAFDDYLAHLTHEGCLSVSRLLLSPPRETLRLAVTAREAVTATGAKRPERHIAIVHAGLWSTLLTCRKEIPAGALSRLRAFVQKEHFALAFDPDHPKLEFGAALTGSDAKRNAFISGYQYRLQPATDEAPFFFNYFKWRNLSALGKLRNETIYGTPVPIGHAVLLATLLVALLLAGIGIYRPLRHLGDTLGSHRRATGTYFAALGFGFLLVEVVLIQRGTFFLGHPTYALTTVLATLLVSSGVGSLLAQRLVEKGRSEVMGPRVLAAVAVAVLVLAAVSYLVWPQLVGLSHPVRVALVVVTVAPVGVLLGMPFPLGVSRLQSGAERAVPWAFGVNGFFTVMASAVAPLLALQVGLSALCVLSGGIYLVALGAWRAGLARS